MWTCIRRAHDSLPPHGILQNMGGGGILIMCRPLIPSSLSHTKSVVIFKTTNMITCSFMFKNVKRNYVLLIKSKQKMCMLSFFEHFPSLNTFAHVQSIAKGNTTMLRVQCNAECCKVCCHKQLLPVSQCLQISIPFTHIQTRHCSAETTSNAIGMYLSWKSEAGNLLLVLGRVCSGG